MATILLSLRFSALLKNACCDKCPGIHIAYRTHKYLLDSRLMQAPTRVSTTLVHDLRFADDNGLSTMLEEDMQKSMELVAAGCTNFGLLINTAETVVLY
ncbi:unnamed protein product [Schistocephalus solidus]|uniref:Reverse transcriptase domain-containing protein n=1 Tax=Schistocephalus solidus TaxID=70667 RepID=A0A3P7CR15_SCHSO|nr:unnamed protein product [Schistocephalus solidus]